MGEDHMATAIVIIVTVLAVIVWGSTPRAGWATG